MSKRKKRKKEWYLITEGRRLASYVGARGGRPGKCKTNQELVDLARQIFGVDGANIKTVVEQIRALNLAAQVAAGKADWVKENVVQLDEHRAPTQKKITDFYESWEWKRVRYDFIKAKDRKCQCCGTSAADGIRIVVDHIKPIRHFWKLRLDPGNLQLLCDDCNMGKGSRDQTDWSHPHGR